MKNQRILSYLMSTQLNEADLQQIAAAGGTMQGTGHATYTPATGVDGDLDFNCD